MVVGAVSNRLQQRQANAQQREAQTGALAGGAGINSGGMGNLTAAPTTAQTAFGDSPGAASGMDKNKGILEKFLTAQGNKPAFKIAMQQTAAKPELMDFSAYGPGKGSKASWWKTS